MTRPAFDYFIDDEIARKGFEQASSAVLIDRWIPLVKFWIPGEPKAQPRVKAARVGVFVRMYTPNNADEWKGQIERFAGPFKPETPYDFPVRLDATFYFNRPETLKKSTSPRDPVPHTVRPDTDNLAKALMDKLVQMRFLADDKIVFDGRVRKYYAPMFGQPGAMVTISRVP